jgi:hypothetical protein
MCKNKIEGKRVETKRGNSKVLRVTSTIMTYGSNSQR